MGILKTYLNTDPTKFEGGHVKMATVHALREGLVLLLAGSALAALSAGFIYGLPKLGEQYGQLAKLLKEHSKAFETAKTAVVLTSVAITSCAAGVLAQDVFSDHMRLREKKQEIKPPPNYVY